MYRADGGRWAREPLHRVQAAASGCAPRLHRFSRMYDTCLRGGASLRSRVFLTAEGGLQGGRATAPRAQCRVHFEFQIPSPSRCPSRRISMLRSISRSTSISRSAVLRLAAQRNLCSAAADTVTVTIEEAQSMTAAALRKIGWDDEDAALQAEIMTAAELCGAPWTLDPFSWTHRGRWHRPIMP